jgi:hypothetical protein
MQSAVAQLVPLTEYREQRQHLFPSNGSLEWFVRKHRATLIEAGALLMIGGRHFAHPEKFDAYIPGAGKEAAASHAQKAAA